MQVRMEDGEISRVLGAIRDELNSVSPDLRDCEQNFTLYDQALRQLETEARTQADSSSRKALMNKAKQFKEDAKLLRNKFNSLKEKSDRGRLTGWSSGDQQDRLLSMNEKSNQGTAALANSARVMLEIEETAIGVTDQLSQNRASIMSTKRKLEETNSMTGTATRILRNMEKNERMKKICSYIAVFVVAIALLYLLFKLVLPNKKL